MTVAPTLTFNAALSAAGIELGGVKLLRHQDTRHTGYLSPYILWRDHRDDFEAYQRTQSFQNASRLSVPYWASFVGTPSGDTLFVGVYRSNKVGPLPFDLCIPLAGPFQPAGSCDFYELTLAECLSEYAGRLFIDWGVGYRSWIQRGDGKRKPITEIQRVFQEPEFPGFSEIIIDLSELETLPLGWAAALGATRGIYLLTCPKTREQYVGSASGIGGFLSRWRDYQRSGHGGNIGLKSRELSDYQVSILETVANTATEHDILHLEQRWKDKLQSRQMGLNRN